MSGLAVQELGGVSRVPDFIQGGDVSDTWLPRFASRRAVCCTGGVVRGTRHVVQFTRRVVSNPRHVVKYTHHKIHAPRRTRHVPGTIATPGDEQITCDIV